MRTQDDLDFVDPNEAPKNEVQNVHEPPGLLSNGLAHNDPINKLEDSTESIVSDITQSRDIVASNYYFPLVKHILMICLAFFVFSNTTPEPFLAVSCKLPVLSSYFHHCAREHDHPRTPVVTPDFITLASLQSGLELVMEDSARSSKVAVDIKESEMALRDLGMLVRHSSLSSKDTLGRDLKVFVEDAKVTSGNLQQFGSRVWGAVDRIVSLNDHTLIMLENIPTSQAITTTHRQEIEAIWLQSIDLLDKTLRRLIHEAQANVGSLQRLEERLHNIEEMVIVEEKFIKVAEQALKGRWFKGMLGMNEEERQSNSASLALLVMVKNDRKRALDHVTGVLFNLKKMSHDLDNLREGVVTPIIIPSSANIPIEAHIKRIRSGTERLVNGQTRMREIEDEYRQRKFSSD